MNETASIVFIVDDDAAVLKSLGRLLRSAELNVETYTSPIEFLERDEPDCPACVVLDLSMPEMNGLEVQQVIADREIPCGVVILTGHGDIPASVRAMKLGAVDFLTKPVDDEELLEAIDEALERQRQVLELRTQYDDLRERFAPLTARKGKSWNWSSPDTSTSRLPTI